MIPSLSQFRRWSYPSKFGFVSFFIGVVISVLQWLFPDSGKHLVESLVPGQQQTIPVPGDSFSEKKLNLAKMEGVTASIPSTEFAVAIPFVRPSLYEGKIAPTYGGNLVALSNVSSLRPESQDIVFAPGKCRFLGTARWTGQPNLSGEATITVVSCVLDNGDSYGFGKFEGPEIGFVTHVEQPTNKELQLVEEDKSVTLPRNGKYLVRFFTPIRELPFKGKSANNW